MPDVEIGKREEGGPTPAESSDWSWYDPAAEQREKRLIFLIAMPVALLLALAGMVVASRLLGPNAAFPTYLILCTVFLALGDELEPRTRPQRRSLSRRVLRRAAHLAVGIVIMLLVVAAFGWRVR